MWEGILMSNASLVPVNVRTPDMVAFDDIVRKRIGNMPVEKLLVYFIDIVDEKALLLLATQFDLLGYKGWRLADTVEKKRALIRGAIELHRYKGTIYAIRRALESIGYPNVKITEHVGHWAGFTIDLNVGEESVNAEQMAAVLEMVKEYKNVRSHLSGIQFDLYFEDGVTITDSSYEGPADMFDDGVSLGGDFKYDGVETYNGSKNYSGDNDYLEITITNA